MVQYYRSESAPRSPQMAILTTTSERRVDAYNQAFTGLTQRVEIKVTLSFPNLENSVCKYHTLYFKDTHQVELNDHTPEIGCNFPWPLQLKGTVHYCLFSL